MHSIKNIINSGAFLHTHICIYIYIYIYNFYNFAMIIYLIYY